MKSDAAREDRGKGESGGSRTRLVTCEEIQGLLFDYMSRELGEARSVVVREHVRKCQDCQAAAAEMQSTVDALKQASTAEAGVPQRLSDEHRARILRAIMHPVMDWIDRHHFLISALVAILLGVAAVVWMRSLSILARDTDPGITVTIGNGPGVEVSPETSPETPP